MPLKYKTQAKKLGSPQIISRILIHTKTWDRLCLPIFAWKSVWWTMPCWEIFLKRCWFACNIGNSLNKRIQKEQTLRSASSQSHQTLYPQLWFMWQYLQSVFLQWQLWHCLRKDMTLQKVRIANRDRCLVTYL